jgi:glycosyltransferase involved in cell wall biosynthesis
MVKNKYLSLLTNVLDNAQQIVCVSEGLANDISKYTSKNIVVISNIVDTNFFVPEEPIKIDSFYRIFTLGYLTKVKGIDLLIKSVAELLRNNKHKDIKLIVGGNGPERENLMELVKSNGLENNVEFLGELNRNEVKSQLQLCDIFALPSRFETFGVALVEAMSMGKPVIATKTHGPKEFVINKVGYLINKEDIKELVNSIEDAIINKKSWKTNSSIIRNYAIEKFSEKVFLKKTSLLYDKTISKQMSHNK